MNMIFRPTENSVAAKSDAAALLALSKRDNPQMARVSTAQHLLFPATPRAICSELGLNWWAAIKLYEDGWLSFCPEDTARLDEAQEAELRFIGSLVISGCDRPMLTSLLSGLSKPYAYHGKRLFYDWSGRQWRLLPEPHSNPEAIFTEWLDTLAASGDIGSLTGILELTHDALARVRVQPEVVREGLRSDA
jgi:hypothetical protein